ncbi:MAG: 50S ribosomal protein L11 methyltransferase [Burkholderiales bacterium]
MRLTRDQFLPIRISIDCGSFPHGTSPDPTAINVVLDPGIAFGTGSHPTTRLCLEWLADGVHGGERVLDYGCGSGILAIAAMKLGVAVVHGVDIDPQAVLAAVRNAEQNRVAAHFTGPDAHPWPCTTSCWRTFFPTRSRRSRCSPRACDRAGGCSFPGFCKRRPRTW